MACCLQIISDLATKEGFQIISTEILQMYTMIIFHSIFCFLIWFTSSL